MSFFSSPTSFRLNDAFASSFSSPSPAIPMMYAQSPSDLMSFSAINTRRADAGNGGGHPSMGHLALLVFEAVLEVVCVSLPGYIIARCGMFDAEMQKFVANLNVSLFTPCLIFTKLASQLTLDKIVDLAVIPVIFIVMTAVSYVCSLAVAKAFGFEKRARNFVIAMGVFGNSNSLPISLVISLAMTISGLHWDRIPGDNDEEVAARGILYLLIFQQLGQLVRWSWGYHVLLAPQNKHHDNETNGSTQRRYRDEPAEDESETAEDTDLEAQDLQVDPFASPRFENSFVGLHKRFAEEEEAPTVQIGARHHLRSQTTGTTDSAFESGPSGDGSPLLSSQSHSSESTRSSSPELVIAAPALGNSDVRDITAFPAITEPSGILPRWASPRSSPSVSCILNAIKNVFIRVYNGFMSFMNPPLWAMLAAVIVASIPKLQHLFFTKGTFIQNSVTRAVSQSGNVAVPLILVVLGANLAGNTQPKTNAEHEQHETKILIASILSRMILPFIFIGPVLALAAKFLNISILDDPIFIVVCFLLTGAPSALQLAQICQINGVYEGVMARVLFWSYVVIILPSTLVLVVSAIEVVHWAM